MPRSEEQRSRERERILSAALGIFAERRFAGSTTALIAKRARVSEATLASHFESKEALFAAVLAPAGLEMVTPSILRRFAATANLPWDDSVALLRTFFAHHAAFIGRHPKNVGPILREALLRPQTFLRALARPEGLYPRFVELVDDLRRRGELRRDLPPMTVLCMVLSVAWGYGFARAVLLPDAEWDDARQAWLFSSVLAEGFRGKGAPRRASSSRGAATKSTTGSKRRASDRPARGRRDAPSRKKVLAGKATAAKSASIDSDRRPPRARP
ncbi:TetR/AcrR family transcriptional regulator [Pendulispora rubella]|uniref:TetR/AcrR family transcriptional regulator n=1 Tax=Pendulispora rubella TaxID=2741070 RepID=A0ABZ2LDW7_9BACT